MSELEKVLAKPDLLLRSEHSLCPGCGEPVALRVILEPTTPAAAGFGRTVVSGLAFSVGTRTNCRFGTSDEGVQ
jgi:pyruvate/2-oxoacid:ferredoxin oxidoreductase beta subunit